MLPKTRTFKDLIVWQKARDVAVLLYRATDKMPKQEMYGLTSQMRRAAVSISSNIAESYNRFHRKEKDQFLSIAFASCAELQSQIEITKMLFPEVTLSSTEALLSEVMSMLNSMLSKKS